MKWVIRILVALFFSFVFFGAIEHYFHFAAGSTVFLAVMLGVCTTFSATLDFVKKFHDARKGAYELRELERKEEAALLGKGSLIRSPSADELRRHGQSVVEQTLDERFRKSGADRVHVRPFVADSEETK